MADAPAPAGGAPADGGAAAGAAAPLPAPATTAASNQRTPEPPGPPVPASINRKERQVLRKHFGIKIGKSADLAEEGAKFRQKQGERKDELKGLRDKVPALEGQLTHATGLIKAHAETALKALPEATQAAIKTAAGDSPVKMLEMILSAQTLVGNAPPPAAPAGTPPAAPAAGANPPAAAAPPAGTPAAPARPVIPAPAGTAAAGAPPPPATQAPVNHRLEWETLRDKNPMAAAVYALEHEREIFDQAAQ